MRVTVPSSEISTKRLGLTELPLACPRAVEIREPEVTLAPSTKAPVTPADFRKVRRLMFCYAEHCQTSSAAVRTAAKIRW